MSKIYAAQPSKHALEILLEGKRGKNKQKAKVREFKKISTPLFYEYEDISITVNSITEGVKGLLIVDVMARKGGKVLDIDTDYRFRNPPVKTGNGTFRRETIGGIETDIENTAVDIIGALKEFLGQAIKTQIK